MAGDAGASSVRRAGIEQQQWDVAYIRFDGLDGWEGYLASRSRNFRPQIGRRERALRKDHQVEVRSATEDTLQDDLAQLFAGLPFQAAGRRIAPSTHPDPPDDVVSEDASSPPWSGASRRSPKACGSG